MSADDDERDGVEDQDLGLATETARRGRDAIESLLVRHLPGLRAFIRLRVGPQVRAKESCSDIAQSVCRELLADLSGFEFRGEAAFTAWLYTAALRRIIDKGRHWAAERRDPAREEHPAAEGLAPTHPSPAEAYRTLTTPSRVAMAKEEVRLLEEAFDRLPEHYKEVVTLARICRLPHAEIARRTGRSEGAVTALLFRALARLSRLLRAAGAAEKTNLEDSP